MTMHKDVLLKKDNICTRIHDVYDNIEAYAMYADLISFGYIDCGDLASDYGIGDLL